MSPRQLAFGQILQFCFTFFVRERLESPENELIRKWSYCRLQLFHSILFELWAVSSSCLYILFWVSDLDPFANFFNPFLWPHLAPLQDITCLCVLPANFHLCSCLYSSVCVPFIKVCHCFLCFPNIFSPQWPSALSLLLQCLADVACVSCQSGT